MTETLAALARKIGRMSRTTFLAQVKSPALVEVGANTQSNSEKETAFRTEYVSAADALSRMLTPERREIFFVEKRANALFSGHISVGRTPNVDICIARTGISKFHAYFSVEHEKYQLTDKDSTNGTFVAGTRLTSGLSTAVTDDTEVRFATHTFRFMLPDRLFDLLQTMV
jgi:pSer/pThr/pTyr-binding forkhead associated (FHA) protein